jgi:DNA repair exonuclease SbcCD ATPase subunit
MSASNERYVVMSDYLRQKMGIHESREALMRLQAACDEMGPMVRWKNVTVPKYAGAETAVDESNDTLSREDDHVQALREKLASRREEEEQVRLQQRAVLAALAKLSGDKLPRLQKKKQVAMQNLAECEQVLSDMEVVNQKLGKQVQDATEAVRQREADLAEAEAVIDHLEGVHRSALEALDVSTTRVSSHMEECSKIDEKIGHWEAKVQEHAREASAASAVSSRKGKGVTAALKLDEARTRLRRAEERKSQLSAWHARVLSDQQEASVSEGRAREELSRARGIAEKAKNALVYAEEKLTSLLREQSKLEGDYGALVPCLEKLLALDDELDRVTAAAFDRSSELDDQHEKLQETLKGIHDEIELLERDIAQQRCEEEAAAADQMVPSLSNEDVSALTPVCHTETFNTTSRRCRPMIPGDLRMLQSADSYHVLARAKSCLAHWRALAARKQAARQECDRRFVSTVAPRALLAWRQHLLEQTAQRERWQARRVLTSSLSAWRRTAHDLRRSALLIESCRALSAARLQESALAAWKETTEQEMICRAAAGRRDTLTRANAFVFWRTETAQNKRLENILAPVQAKKEMEVSRESFKEWRQATQTRLTLRRVFQGALDVWSQRVVTEQYCAASNRLTVLDDCMGAWSLVVHQAREDRRLAAIYEAIHSNHQRGLLRAHFRGLRTAVYIQKRDIAAIVLDSEERQRRATLGHVFSYLRSWAAHRALLSTQLRVKWSYDHPLRNAVLAWQAAMDRRHAMDDRRMLCDKLRQILPGTSARERANTDSGIKSATYMATEMSEISFADENMRSGGNAPMGGTEPECTAISL